MSPSTYADGSSVNPDHSGAGAEANSTQPSTWNLANGPRVSYRVPGHLVLSPSSDIQSADRREYSAVLLRPGRVKAADGSDSNWLIPRDVVARDAHLFNGVACYLDHPEMFGFGWRGEPQVRNLFGVTQNVYWSNEERALLGTIRLYHEDTNSPGALVAHILDQMLADKAAGLNVPEVGLSAVFFHETEFDEEHGTKVTTRFKKVESVDLVYSPGAGGYIKAALSAIRPQGDVPIMSEETRNPQEEDADESLLHQVAGLNAAVAGLQAEMQALNTDLEGIPAVSAEDSAATVEDLHAQVQHLTQVLASQDRTVQGMGSPPSDRVAQLFPARFSLTHPHEELQAAWDWIFGVEDAVLPNPELRRTDYLYRLLSGDLNWSGVFDEREALATASTTTLADMAVNAMNKVIVPLYDRLDVYRWYEQITTVQATDGSLHDMAWLQFGGIGDLPIVAEGAAYTELAVGDTKEADSFVKYGGYVGITDKVLRNSDIARLQAVPRALTLSAVQTRSAKIAAIFTDASGTGPTLDQDSVVLFHTVSHANLATTAFSWSAWKAARIECAKHSELTSSKRTGFFPKFGLFPVDLYDEALKVFGYGQGPGGQPDTADNAVNPFGAGRPGDPRPSPLLVPDWTDANDWAYVVDPLIAPVIQMAYADSPGGRVHPAPQLFSVTSPTAGLMFTNDVLPIKVRDYFAYGVATYRGIGKRNVG